MQIEGTKLIKVEKNDIKDGHFEIPKEVTEINTEAFLGCTSLTTVVFNENLTQIGNQAFAGCKGLTSITFSKNLTKINSGAFTDCTGLTSVTFNKNLTQIGSSAFSGCSGLTSVSFNENLTQIGNSAFYSCSGLTSVTFNKNLNRIGSWAFQNCTGLTAEIDSWAFQNHTGLTTITLNENITEINEEAFDDSTILKKIIIDNKDDAHFNRIRNLLPEDLRGNCIKKSLVDQLKAIKEDVLQEILAEPATNPMRRSMKTETYTHDVWLLLNKYTQDSNVFYKKAKKLMDSLPWPKSDDKESLRQYREKCKKICGNCLDMAKRTICKSPHTLQGEFAAIKNYFR